MNVDFTKEGGVQISLPKPKFDDLGVNLNGFLDKAGADETANHYDIIDILKNHGIIIKNGGNHDKK